MSFVVYYGEASLWDPTCVTRMFGLGHFSLKGWWLLVSYATVTALVALLRHKQPPRAMHGISSTKYSTGTNPSPRVEKKLPPPPPPPPKSEYQEGLNSRWEIVHWACNAPVNWIPGRGGRDGAGIVHRPSALFCIVPGPRGTFFCH